MKIYTIGFTKKSAEYFFDILKKNEVTKVIDIRLNVTSQLAGFAKGRDLEYFLREINRIEYLHLDYLAPTKDLLTGYKKNQMTWEDYIIEYTKILDTRDALNMLGDLNLEKVCFLCSEDKPDKCHRRLLVEAIKEKSKTEVEIIHLI